MRTLARLLLLQLLLCAVAFPDRPPEYDWKPKSTRKSQIDLTLTERKDYGSVMYDFGRTSNKVVEYQKPTAMFSQDGKVKNLGYRNSEEGVHVGSRKNFTANDRRQPYRRVTVEFDGIYCDYFGEDAFTVDPLGKAIIRKGQWRGCASSGGSSRKPGNDKCFQVDGGRLELKAKSTGAIVIENAARAVRGKANSIIIIDGVDFVGCETCIMGDGKRNPPGKNWRYFNGNPGKCLILVKNCRFWNCPVLAEADDDCVIFWENNNRVFGIKGQLKDTGGTIKKGDNLSAAFEEEIEKLYKRSSNEW